MGATLHIAVPLRAHGALLQQLGMTRSLADWLAFIEAQHPRAIDMGLERVREVAARMGLGRPARHVISVAGTNGKGSTVAFLEGIARAGGWRVGAYTSPHLLRYNERVRIDGAEAGDAALVEAFEAVEAARGHTLLTYFEFGTLAALWLFQRSELDLAILEVGLGGRLDATNLVDPDVAVITTVDLDHQDWLGGDREVIGAEKAGIARAWKPLVLGEDDPPASVLRHAYAIGASAVRIGCDFFFEAPSRRSELARTQGSSAADGVRASSDLRKEDTWRWREIGFEAELPLPALAAPVQLRNAAVAIAALRALDAPFDAEVLAAGVAAARIAARLQAFEIDGVAFLVDVGHNPQAARTLAEALAAKPAAGRTFAVYAALSDKEPAGVVEALAPQVDAWLLAGSEAAGPRGQSADALAARLTGTAAALASRHADVAAALAAVRGQAQAGDRVLVFGSFHAAGEALQAFGNP